MHGAHSREPARSPERVAQVLSCMTTLLASGDERIFFKDLEGRFLLVSAGFIASLTDGWSLDEVIGRTDFDIFSAPHAAAALADERRVIATGEPMAAKVERETFTDRPDVWVSTTKAPLYDDQGTLIGTWGTSRDVTAQIEAEQALLQQTLNLRAVIDNSPAIVCIKDRDHRYELVNRGFEAAFGVSSAWIIGRRDEDILPMSLVSEVHAKDRRVLDGGPMTQDEELFPRDGQERVFLTMRFPLHDDRGGVRGVCVSSIDITARRHEEEAKLEELQCSELIHSALVHERFVLHGQPIMNLATMQVEQAELLIRMRDDRGGSELIAPGEFLPSAERFGLISLIDGWVIDGAVKLAAAGHRVAVNVSAITISDPEQVGRIERAISDTRAPPGNLIFEITETAVADNVDAARTFALRLRALGCAFALDDFGVGHGTFTYLRHLPVDYLKIDSRFVTNLLRYEEDHQVVRAIIGVAQRFRIKTVAEGVEDHDTLRELGALGADFAQGFHIGRPMPLEQLWGPQGGGTHDT